MPLKRFDLGGLQLRYKTSHTILRVTCSCVVELPASIKEDINLDEVARLTTDGELWMAKATVCQMDVTASIPSTVGGASSSLESLASAISECPVRYLMRGSFNSALTPRRSGQRLVLH